MGYNTEVLLKEDNQWYWLGRNSGRGEYDNILGIFNLTKHKGEADVFFAQNINNWTLTDPSWIEPIEAIRRHPLKEDYFIEFRRNPYKLNLGIIELIVTKKEKTNEI